MPNSTVFACITPTEIVWTRRPGLYNGGCHHILKCIMEVNFKQNPSIENFINIINDENDGKTPLWFCEECIDCPDFIKRQWNYIKDDISIINQDPYYISESIVIFNAMNIPIVLQSVDPHLVGECIEPLSVWWN